MPQCRRPTPSERVGTTTWGSSWGYAGGRRRVLTPPIADWSREAHFPLSKDQSVITPPTRVGGWCLWPLEPDGPKPWIMSHLFKKKNMPAPLGLGRSLADPPGKSGAKNQQFCFEKTRSQGEGVFMVFMVKRRTQKKFW